MKKIRAHLTYANVASTLALAGVIGGGSAYAVATIGSGDLKNNAIRSADLKDNKAVAGRDVRRDTLRGTNIDETTLDASRFAPLAADEGLNCDPVDANFVDCASATIELNRPAQLLVIATGDFYSEGGAADLDCRIAVDGVNEVAGARPGEETSDNTSAGATHGFTRTQVTEPQAAGSHSVALRCAQPAAQDGRLATATVAVLAVGRG